MEHSPLTITRLVEFFGLGALVEGSTKHKCGCSAMSLVRRLGDVEASSIDVAQAYAYQGYMKDVRRLSPATVRSQIASLSQVWAWGIEAGLVESNPWRRIKRVKCPKVAVRIFDGDEVVDLIQAAAEIRFRDHTASMRWTAMLHIASDSGLRIGEIQNLRWDDLDLDGGCVSISCRADRPGECWQWGPKAMTDRSAPLSQAAMECLYRLAEVAPWRYPFLKRVTCERLLARVGNIPEHTRKQPYTNLYRELDMIKALANRRRLARGLAPIKNGGPHQLRKTAVTLWARSGVPMIDAQVVAGHREMATTRKYYIAVDQAASVARIRNAIDSKGGPL